MLLLSHALPLDALSYGTCMSTPLSCVELTVLLVRVWRDRVLGWERGGGYGDGEGDGVVALFRFSSFQTPLCAHYTVARKETAEA